MNYKVIVERFIGNDTVERIVLGEDGHVRVRWRNYDHAWTTVREYPPLWGRIRYRQELRALRALREAF